MPATSNPYVSASIRNLQQQQQAGAAQLQKTRDFLGSMPRTSTPITPAGIASPAPVSSPSTPSAPGTAGKIIDYAKQFLGTPYKWGGSNPQTGFDCSGLVQYVYSKFGIKMPRVSSQQAQTGIQVSADQAMPGDLVYFNEHGNGVDHIGIYVGGGKMLEAPHTGDVVKIAPVGNAAGYTRVLSNG